MILNEIEKLGVSFGSNFETGIQIVEPESVFLQDILPKELLNSYKNLGSDYVYDWTLKLDRVSSLCDGGPCIISNTLSGFVYDFEGILNFIEDNGAEGSLEIVSDRSLSGYRVLSLEKDEANFFSSKFHFITDGVSTLFFEQDLGYVEEATNEEFLLKVLSSLEFLN